MTFFPTQSYAIGVCVADDLFQSSREKALWQPWDKVVTTFESMYKQMYAYYYCSPSLSFLVYKHIKYTSNHLANLTLTYQKSHWYY